MDIDIDINIDADADAGDYVDYATYVKHEYDKYVNAIKNPPTPKQYPAGFTEKKYIWKRISVGNIKKTGEMLFLQKFNINHKNAYIPEEIMGTAIFMSIGTFSQPYFIFEKNKIKDILPLYDLPFFTINEFDNEESYIVWRLHAKS